jgi:hypothetical protein
MEITGAATGGAVIFAQEIRPDMSLVLLPGDTSYIVMTPMAYVARMHRFWHGGFKIALYFWSPSLQKCTIRVSYYPNSGTASAVPDNQSGDITSKVVDIVGDTIVPFEIPYISMMPQMPCVDPDTPANTYNSVGSFVVQIVSPISSQLQPSPAVIHGLVYAATAEGFAWVSNYLNRTAWTYSTLIPALPAAKSKPVEFSTASRIHRAKDHSEVTMFGVPVISAIAPATDQSNPRDIFGTKFPSMVPITPKSHSGLVDPDMTHGPVEYLKRFMAASTDLSDHVLELATGTPYPIYNFGPFSDDLIHPWKSFSGGSNYKCVLTSPLLPTVPVMISVDGGDVGTNITGTGGMAFFDLTKDPSFTVGMPYVSVAFARETYPDHPEWYTGDIAYRMTALGVPAFVSAEFYLYHSVADDFSLYHFQAPAYLVRVV